MGNPTSRRDVVPGVRSLPTSALGLGFATEKPQATEVISRDSSNARINLSISCAFRVHPAEPPFLFQLQTEVLLRVMTQFRVLLVSPYPFLKKRDAKIHACPPRHC